MIEISWCFQFRRPSVEETKKRKFEREVLITETCEKLWETKEIPVAHET
jgi:hypothetical protein